MTLVSHRFTEIIVLVFAIFVTVIAMHFELDLRMLMLVLVLCASCIFVAVCVFLWLVWRRNRGYIYCPVVMGGREQQVIIYLSSLPATGNTVRCRVAIHEHLLHHDFKWMMLDNRSGVFYATPVSEDSAKSE